MKSLFFLVISRKLSTFATVWQLKPIITMTQDSTFDRKRHFYGAVLGPLIAALIWFSPIDGLNDAQHHLLSIMSLVAIWWITEPVAIPVTSLLGPTLCVLVGIVPMKEAFESFGSPMIFLFMGGFLIAKGMMVNGLDKRIAYGIMSMKWVGDSPRRIFIALGVACMLCSGWISNTATAAMMFPIALGLLEAIREMMAANGRKIDLSNYKYATGLMLMTAYACSIGGAGSTGPRGVVLRLDGMGLRSYGSLLRGGLLRAVEDVPCRCRSYRRSPRVHPASRQGTGQVDASPEEYPLRLLAGRCHLGNPRHIEYDIWCQCGYCERV